MRGLLAVPLLALKLSSLAVWQFRQMMVCVMPGAWPVLTFTRYGCYCGLGGAGQPLDDLDRCCKVHDECYEATSVVGSCSPYFRSYEYTCDDMVLACTSSDPCEHHVCECDRVAAECFARSDYNEEHKAVDFDKVCRHQETADAGTGH